MQIRNNFEIKNLTTYKIGGKVKTLYLPETLEELTSILRELDEYVVLGSCSDVLFSSNGYSGNVIITTEMKKFEIRGTKIYAECGVKDPMLAKSVSEVSLSGLEFLIGLPGTIGGAVFLIAKQKKLFIKIKRICNFHTDTRFYTIKGLYFFMQNLN